MPVLTTVAVIVVSASLVGAFLAGRASAPDDVEHVAGLVEAQSAQIEAIAEGQQKAVEAASRPVVIDAEIRDTLAQVPPACAGEKGDPRSIECSVQTCWQYGQSSAQRPECGDIIKEYLRQQRDGCPE